jgi:hypothetical protein
MVRAQCLHKSTQGDVTQYVDKAQGECLNQSVDHKWDNIFKKDDSFLESDTDEQLLVYIPFNQPIKIHSLCFQALDAGTQRGYLAIICGMGKIIMSIHIFLTVIAGRAPQTVKLFVNKRDMDFQSVDSAPATQEVELKADDVKGDKLIPLRYIHTHSSRHHLLGISQTVSSPLSHTAGSSSSRT